jgi:hypothetical protein
MLYSFYPCAVRSLTRSAYVALYKCYIFGSCPTKEEKIRLKNHTKSEPRTKDRGMLRNGNIQRTVKEKDDTKMTIKSHSKIAERADIIVPHVANGIGSKEDSGRSKIKAKSESVTFLKRKDDNKEKKIAARADRTVLQKSKDEDSENTVTSQAKMAAQAARAGHLKVSAKNKKSAAIRQTQQRHFGLADLLKN